MFLTWFNWLRARSEVINDLLSESKGYRLESGD